MLSEDFILMRPIRLKIDLIPGPPHNDKLLYSHAIQVIARYPAHELAGAISRIAYVKLATDGSRDPRAWQWIWRHDDRIIRVGFTVMGSKTDVNLAWGGSTLDAECLVGDLITFWSGLRESHPDTWLHYDGRVYTAGGFVDRLRDMIESQTITDIV
jgi:hypothetical protein